MYKKMAQHKKFLVC